MSSAGSPPDSSPTLVCFAVPDEARPFRRLQPRGTRVLVTGMGPIHARERLQQHLASRPTPPKWIVTAGFAGALNPRFSTSDIVFDADPASGLGPRLLAVGALPATFHASPRVATTAEAKRSLRTTTQADAVEMESGPIRALCQSLGIPSATIRVISDTADEDLPLDFNDLMGPDGQIAMGRLIRAVLCSPGRIPALIQLGRTSSRAAHTLARTLVACLPVTPA